MSWIFANDHHITDVEDRAHAVSLSIEPLRTHHLQSFVLDAQTIALLQESSPLYAQAKEQLLKDAASATSLEIKDERFQEAPDFLAPFIHVNTLWIKQMNATHLPNLPCKEHLIHLSASDLCLKSLSQLASYPNLQKCVLTRIVQDDKADALQGPSPFFMPLATLCNLRELFLIQTLDLCGDHKAHEALFVTIMHNNTHLKKLVLSGHISDAVCIAIAHASLDELLLTDSQLDDRQLALLPLSTLKALTLTYGHLKAIEPLRAAGLHTLVLSAVRLRDIPDFDTAFPKILCTMTNLKKLILYGDDLRDIHVEPLLALTSQLDSLALGGCPHLSAHVRQTLDDAFADKIFL